MFPEMFPKPYAQQLPTTGPCTRKNSQVFQCYIQKTLVTVKSSSRTFVGMKKRLTTVAILCLVMLLLFFLLPKLKNLHDRQIMTKKYISCYHCPSRNDSLAEFKWDHESKRNIFFLETSCNPETLEFKCRQACAVESAALQNPNSTVRLLFVSPSPPSDHASLLLRQLSSYENIKINHINADEFVKNTPIEHWFGSWLFTFSPWPIIDMSDIMRLVTIWKFGGIYLDLDIIVLKSLEDLDNFTVSQSNWVIATGVFGLHVDELGKKIANLFLADMMQNFDHNRWGSIGPDLMTRVSQKVCQVQEISKMTPERCKGFKILPSEEFYPIDFNSWRRYFTSDNLNETMRIIEKSRGIHVWNKLSHSKAVKIDQKVPYTIVAQQYCPLTYHNCGNTF